MIDFYNLNRQELARSGILFESSEEAESFIGYIMEKLEILIGKEISKQCTPQQLNEFDCITDIAETRRWLEKNCPSYRMIVSEKSLWFEIILLEELLENRHEIVGVTLDERIISEQLSDGIDDYLRFYGENRLTGSLDEDDEEGFLDEGLLDEVHFDEDLLDEEYPA